MGLMLYVLIKLIVAGNFAGFNFQSFRAAKFDPQNLRHVLVVALYHARTHGKDLDLASQKLPTIWYSLLHLIASDHKACIPQNSSLIIL